MLVLQEIWKIYLSSTRVQKSIYMNTLQNYSNSMETMKFKHASKRKKAKLLRFFRKKNNHEKHEVKTYLQRC